LTCHFFKENKYIPLPIYNSDDVVMSRGNRFYLCLFAKGGALQPHHPLLTSNISYKLSLSLLGRMQVYSCLLSPSPLLLLEYHSKSLLFLFCSLLCAKNRVPICWVPFLLLHCTDVMPWLPFFSHFYRFW
jgi:hypothetical protein